MEVNKSMKSERAHTHNHTAMPDRATLSLESLRSTSRKWENLWVSKTENPNAPDLFWLCGLISHTLKESKAKKVKIAKKGQKKVMLRVDERYVWEWQTKKKSQTTATKNKTEQRVFNNTRIATKGQRHMKERVWECDVCVCESICHIYSLSKAGSKGDDGRQQRECCSTDWWRLRKQTVKHKTKKKRKRTTCKKKNANSPHNNNVNINITETEAGTTTETQKLPFAT